jgi:hypothetical protein
LDLAANAGHNLGSGYSPSKLRAIRRFSIHRVFDILDTRYKQNTNVENMLKQLSGGRDNVIISTNWDITVEKHFASIPENYNYAIPIHSAYNGELMENHGLKLLKLHGSSNWVYCDCCRKLYAFPGSDVKDSLYSRTYLEERDFKALSLKINHKSEFWKQYKPRLCPNCNVRLTARIATFSFSKALGYFQFQAVWESALRALSDARRWIFIGYSLPDADFELRHMLKTAQLCNSRLEKITVVIGDDEPTRQRYLQFFGPISNDICTEGYDSWISNQALIYPAINEINTDQTTKL